MKKVTAILDWFDRVFKRLKALGYLIAIVLAILFFVNNGFKRHQAIKLAEKILHLDLEKEGLLNDKNILFLERDSLRNVNYELKGERDRAISDKYEARQQVLRYKRERNLLAGQIEVITSDSSYNFLQQSAYPFAGDKKYGFNARQVKGIHLTFLENENSIFQINTLEIELDHCNTALITSTAIEETSDAIYETMEEELSVTEGMVEVEEEKNKLLTKSQKKERFWKGFWKVTTVIGFGVGLAL